MSILSINAAEKYHGERFILSLCSHHFAHIKILQTVFASLIVPFFTISNASLSFICTLPLIDSSI